MAYRVPSVLQQWHSAGDTGNVIAHAKAGAPAPLPDAVYLLVLGGRMGAVLLIAGIKKAPLDGAA